MLTVLVVQKCLVRTVLFFAYIFALSYLQRPERPSHDMADVLLSLKHAVLKPSPDPQQMQSQSQNYNHPQASLSYTVHPQILVSPTQSQAQTANYNSMNYYENPCSGQHQHVSPPSMYPSMSVNVSMNMTMHGYGSDTVPMQCSQVKKKKKRLKKYESKHRINANVACERCSGHHRPQRRR